MFVTLTDRIKTWSGTLISGKEDKKHWRVINETLSQTPQTTSKDSLLIYIPRGKQEGCINGRRKGVINWINNLCKKGIQPRKAMRKEHRPWQGWHRCRSSLRSLQCGIRQENTLAENLTHPVVFVGSCRRTPGCRRRLPRSRLGAHPCGRKTGTPTSAPQNAWLGHRSGLNTNLSVSLAKFSTREEKLRLYWP